MADSEKKNKKAKGKANAPKESTQASPFDSPPPRRRNPTILPKLMLRTGFVVLAGFLVHKAYFDDKGRNIDEFLPQQFRSIANQQVADTPQKKAYAYPKKSLKKRAETKEAEAAAAPKLAAEKDLAKTSLNSSIKCPEPKKVQVSIAAKLPAKISYLNRFEGAKVRRGPGIKYEKLMTLPAGKVFKGTPQNGWVRMDYGHYINKKLLLDLDTEPDTPPMNRWVAAASAVVRKIPNPKGSIKSQIPRGEALKVTQVDQWWFRLKGGGYIHRKTLSRVPVLPTTFPAKMLVTSKANIRSGPGTSYPIIGLFFQNKVLKIQAIEGKWAKLSNDQFVSTAQLVLKHTKVSRKNERKKNSL